jgi:2-dehydropantoate 2-reductase
VKIIVVGAGAVGSRFGAALFAAGHDVVLVGRADHVAAIRSHGLRVEGPHPRTYHLPATTDVGHASADAVLVAVKTFHLTSASEAIAREIAPPAPLLLLENGLGIEGVAEAGLAAGGWRDPRAWLVRGVNSVPATWVAPGVVRETGSGEVLLPSAGSSGPARRHIPLLNDLLTSAGIPVRLVADFDREVWRKALVNAAINPVTALHGVVNGALLREPLRTEAVRLLREAQAAARAEGFEFPDREADADLDRVARATAENRSSMLQDLDRGRPTEIDALSEEIARLGTRHGLELAATRAAAAAIRARVAQAAARGQGS